MMSKRHRVSQEGKGFWSETYNVDEGEQVVGDLDMCGDGKGTKQGISLLKPKKASLQLERIKVEI
jgi:hypothetical protein